ncbi:MAG: UvrD-helicase domain-containing protein, partial [Cytophagales bacterium]
MLTLCYASAGAGKTRSLVYTYLRHSLITAGDFRRIAAVTFTNKAAAEMKHRILSELRALARGEGLLGKALQADLGYGPTVLQQHAQRVYDELLAHYEAFTVTTIDGFFQSMVDGFRRELALPDDHEITLSVKGLLESSIATFWRRLPENRLLEKALITFATYKIRHKKYWDITQEMLLLGYQVLRSFTLPPSARVDTTAFFVAGTKQARAFEVQLSKMASRLRDHIRKQGYAATDFMWGERGILGFLKKLEAGKQVSVSSRVRKGCTEVAAWVSQQKQSSALVYFVENHCLPALAAIVAYYDQHIKFYNTIRALQPLHYALLTTEQLRTIFLEEANKRKKIPINRLPKLLKSLLDRYPVDFIYTHLGQRYDYLLIDEFQDVSRLQWTLLYPFIAHGLSKGGGAFLVGDVKQA